MINLSIHVPGEEGGVEAERKTVGWWWWEWNEEAQFLEMEEISRVLVKLLMHIMLLA